MLVPHFASQPASFNQVHQPSVQPARTQDNPIPRGENDNQPNIWLHTNPTNTNTRMCRKLYAHTARALHTWAHENACVVTLVHPHTHAQASTSSAQNNQTLKKKKTSLSWFDAVGELGFNSRS